MLLIEKLKLAGYFLIVWDIVRFCREQNILVQGRGSAANSAVCYSLGITAVDPVGMELLFERFLSEERGEWPDIDLDLPSGDQREKAIQYVYQRYGQLGAAMTANVITYRGRSAAREVGKGAWLRSGNARPAIEPGQQRSSGAVPADTLENHLQQAGFDLNHSRIQKYLRAVRTDSGFAATSGPTFRAAWSFARDSSIPLFLWSPLPCPVASSSSGTKTIAPTWGSSRWILLGLGMMAVLEECVELIPKHYGKPLDLAQLPADDPLVYETLRRADTVGMFQVESRAQMASLPRNAPYKFYDLVVQVAIIRPGPIVGKDDATLYAAASGKEERFAMPIRRSSRF